MLIAPSREEGSNGGRRGLNCLKIWKKKKKRGRGEFITLSQRRKEGPFQQKACQREEGGPVAITYFPNSKKKGKR